MVSVLCNVNQTYYIPSTNSLVVPFLSFYTAGVLFPILHFCGEHGEVGQSAII